MFQNAAMVSAIETEARRMDLLLTSATVARLAGWNLRTRSARGLLPTWTLAIEAACIDLLLFLAGLR